MLHKTKLLLHRSLIKTKPAPDLGLGRRKPNQGVPAPSFDGHGGCILSAKKWKPDQTYHIQFEIHSHKEVTKNFQTNQSLL
jgi:hypothetical protein